MQVNQAGLFGHDSNGSEKSQPPQQMLNADLFPAGLVVTTLNDLHLIEANAVFYQICQRSVGSVLRFSEILTPAANIMLESYVLPLLHHQQRCDEIQLTLLVGQPTTQMQRIPVLLNAQLVSPAAGDNHLVYWVVTPALQRDSLYQELLNLRNALEKEAQRLERLSQLDELTGLLNRRAFQHRALALLNQAQRQQHYVAFLLLDIDFFKQVNDQHGHLVGDQVLQAFAQRLASHCRDHDVLARIGGEEFAMLLQVQQATDALQVAEKYRALVAAQPLAGLTITISIGVAYIVATEYQADSRGLQLFETLYKSADQSLYQAKQQGRNQVVVG